MRILISGSHGLIGTALCDLLQTNNHTVFKLVRSNNSSAPNEIAWDPQNLKLDPAAIENFDAIIHLGGSNIAAQRWSKKFKNELAESRISSTLLLTNTIAKLKNRPQVFLCASAIGFYGDRGDETLTEDSPAGQGFLPKLAIAWEEAAMQVQEHGVRAVTLRFGVVLSKQGGALAKMLPFFKLGLGGPLGSGRHYMSWIGLSDAAGAILHILQKPDISGAVNIVSPNPLTNSEFTRHLARALKRPAIFPLPRFMARILFGEIADEALFASSKVLPIKLQQSGFQFKNENIDILSVS